MSSRYVCSAILGFVAISAAAHSAQAAGRLQYWALLPERAESATPEQYAADTCRGHGGRHKGHEHFYCGDDASSMRVGRTVLYTEDPELPLALEENVAVYAADGCAVFFDTTLTDDAIEHLLDGTLRVRLELCPGSSRHHGPWSPAADPQCTFEMATVVAVDEPVDTYLGGVVGPLRDALASVQTSVDDHVAADGDLEADNELQTLSRSGNEVTLSQGGGTVTITDADADPTNELQTWGTLPGIPAGFADGVDDVQDADADPTNELQVLSRSGTIVSLSNGGSVSIADNDDSSTNELQTLSFNNASRVLTISGRNSVIIPTGQGVLVTHPRTGGVGSCNPPDGTCATSCSCSCSHGLFGSCGCSCDPPPCNIGRECLATSTTSCGPNEALTGVLTGTWNGNAGSTAQCTVSTACVANPNPCSCSCSGSLFGGSCSCSCSGAASCNTPIGNCAGTASVMCASLQ